MEILMYCCFVLYVTVMDGTTSSLELLGFNLYILLS